MILKLKFSGNTESIKLKLEELGYAKFSKAIKGEYWIDGVAERHQIEFTKILNQISDEEQIQALFYDLENEEELLDNEQSIIYDKEDILKKSLIADRSHIWLSDTTVRDAISRMRDIDKLENEYGKSILDFTEEDVKKGIKKFWEESNNAIITLTRKARLAYDMANNYEGDSLEHWAKYSSQTHLYSLIDDTKMREIITKDNILKFFKVYDNPQVAIILLLIFEGVTMSINPNVDEMSELVKQNIVTNGLYIAKRDSIIEMDEQTLKAIRTSANQKVFRGVIKRNVFDPMLVNNDFILRPVEGTRSKDQLGYNGLRLRFTHAKEAFKYMFGSDDFLPQTLRNLGKIHYINQGIKSGLTFKHALIKTLQRYGEYEYYVSEDVKPYDTVKLSNTTREVRLKNLWEIYNSEHTN